MISFDCVKFTMFVHLVHPLHSLVVIQSCFSQILSEHDAKFHLHIKSVFGESQSGVLLQVDISKLWHKPNGCELMYSIYLKFQSIIFCSEMMLEICHQNLMSLCVFTFDANI